MKYLDIVAVFIIFAFIVFLIGVFAAMIVAHPIRLIIVLPAIAVIYLLIRRYVE